MPAVLALLALLAAAPVAGSREVGPPARTDEAAVAGSGPSAAAAGGNVGPQQPALAGDDDATGPAALGAAPAAAPAAAAPAGPGTTTPGALAGGAGATPFAPASPGPSADTDGPVAQTVSLWRVVIAPAAVLALLGVVAVLLRRRRNAPSAPLELVGTLPLGPRRQLVVVRFKGEELLVGASEAGLNLLVRHAPAATHGADDGWLTSLASDAGDVSPDPWQAPPAASASPAAVAAAAEVASPGGEFESMLDDSVEDQSLRRKLAAGLRGGRS
jgi:flagellar biogenesis protein FliO